MAKRNKNNKNKQLVLNETKAVSKRPVQLDYVAAVENAKRAISGIDRKLWRSVPKGTTYDWVNNSNFNNIVYPRDKIPDRLLRMIEIKNGIVASVITLRIQQIIEFSNISHNKDIPGWEIVLKDPDATLNSKQKQQKEFLEKLFWHTKVSDYNGMVPHHGTIKDMMTKYVRDRILIDKVCWEIERNQKGEAIAIWVLDGATILPVLPGGFYGSTAQIGYGVSPGYNKLTDAIRLTKIANIPPVEEIQYVQELFFGSSGGGISAAFRTSDLIYDLSNEINDVRYYKQGLSVTEKANMAIVAFINALTFNSNGLSRGSIPKIALSMGKDSGYTQEQLEDAQDEWAANLAAMDGQWNIPLLNGDARVLNLFPNNREMEYQKYMEFTGALTCAIMGVDSAEIGLRLNQAQAVLSENQDAKQLFSKNRGTHEMLGGFLYIGNRLLEISGYDFANDFLFKFNGLNVTDKNYEADLKKKQVETYITVNELRAMDDKEPDEYGDIICNPQYIQYRLAMEQQKQMQQSQQGGAEGGFPGGESGGESGGEDMNDTVDEVMSQLNKAIRLI